MMCEFNAQTMIARTDLVQTDGSEYMKVVCTRTKNAEEWVAEIGARKAQFSKRARTEQASNAALRQAFIAERDSFYMATVSESGWPYVQHRGGPPGFIRILDERTLAIPDFRGNRQYISTGNLATDDRAALILMDYPHRRRLKLYAHVEAKDLTADPELAAEADTARLSGEGRARSYHPSDRVRLELSAAHHSAF